MGHYWGDDWFEKNGNDLYAACNYLEKNCKRWARLGIYTKEKWGVMRVSTTSAFWTYWPVHSILYPGYHYYQWNGKLIDWMEYPLAKVFMTLGITRVVNRYQVYVLKYFWKRAAKKWPHIAKEIMADYREEQI